MKLESRPNLLPYDGEVYYFGKILAGDEADLYLVRLLENIAWRNDETILFGKRIITRRMVAWYGERNFKYTYSNTTKYALPWTEELQQLKASAEHISGETYNSCLLNLYHNGEEGMGWHSDGEPDLKKNGAIASLSFGADRRFVFKHKTTGEKVETYLEHGSLLVMKGTTQSFWLHCLPPARRIREPRVNLTFRTIEE